MKATPKIAQVRHPLIEVWAKKHFELELEIRQAIEKMTAEEVQAVRHAVSSLTTTNCWFAEYDVKPMVEEILAEKEWRDRMAADKAREQSAALGQGSDK